MMLTKDSRLKKVYKAIEPFIEEFGISQIRIFGSYARGEETPQSDIDIIVDIGKQIGIYQFIGLKQDIEATLNKNIDLFKPNTLEAFIKDQILAEAITIYEQR
ncbi:MAG: nucleotidyltransferase family protein [Candidatus Cloacimonas sp.]|nr:nucleotidyltransferase family protein [Candidatus Cloacimonas sp.]